VTGTVSGMTREQAQTRATQLNDDLPNGADHHWIAHHVDADEWRVVRMGAAGIHFSGGERHATVRPSDDPADLDRQRQDPRPWITRAIPPFGPN
jgi:hypothetical protein